MDFGNILRELKRPLGRFYLICYACWMPRRIPPSGINLFQSIYILLDEYQRRTGQPAFNLSLGNPDGVPPEAKLENITALVETVRNFK